jgi:hypothetical protein
MTVAADTSCMLSTIMSTHVADVKMSMVLGVDVKISMVCVYVARDTPLRLNNISLTLVDIEFR